MKDPAVWRAVLTEIETPLPPQIVAQAISYLVDSAKKLPSALEQLRGTNIADLQEAGAYALKQASLDNKLRKNSNSFIAKTVPIIGPVISGLAAINSVYYGFYYFRDSMRFAQRVGLSWSDTLEPDKISAAIERYRNSPEGLTVIIQATKMSNAFVCEGISVLTNSLDGVKDLLFLLIDALSGGGAAVVDFGISALLWVIEMKLSDKWREEFAPIMTRVRTIAETKISEIEAPPVAKEDDFDVENWWRSITA